MKCCGRPKTRERDPWRPAHARGVGCGAGARVRCGAVSVASGVLLQQQVSWQEGEERARASLRCSGKLEFDHREIVSAGSARAVASSKSPRRSTSPVVAVRTYTAHTPGLHCNRLHPLLYPHHTPPRQALAHPFASTPPVAHLHVQAPAVRAKMMKRVSRASTRETHRLRPSSLFSPSYSNTSSNVLPRVGNRIPPNSLSQTGQAHSCRPRAIPNSPLRSTSRRRNAGPKVGEQKRKCRTSFL